MTAFKPWLKEAVLAALSNQQTVGRHLLPGKPVVMRCCTSSCTPLSPVRAVVSDTLHETDVLLSVNAIRQFFERQEQSSLAMLCHSLVVLVNYSMVLDPRSASVQLLFTVENFNFLCETEECYSPQPLNSDKDVVAAIDFAYRGFFLTPVISVKKDTSDSFMEDVKFLLHNDLEEQHRLVPGWANINMVSDSDHIRSGSVCESPPELSPSSRNQECSSPIIQFMSPVEASDPCRTTTEFPNANVDILEVPQSTKSADVSAVTVDSNTNVTADEDDAYSEMHYDCQDFNNGLTQFADVFTQDEDEEMYRITLPMVDQQCSLAPDAPKSDEIPSLPEVRTTTHTRFRSVFDGDESVSRFVLPGLSASNDNGRPSLSSSISEIITSGLANDVCDNLENPVKNPPSCVLKPQDKFNSSTVSHMNSTIDLTVNVHGLDEHSSFTRPSSVLIKRRDSIQDSDSAPLLRYCKADGQIGFCRIRATSVIDLESNENDASSIPPGLTQFDFTQNCHITDDDDNSGRNDDESFVETVTELLKPGGKGNFEIPTETNICYTNKAVMDNHQYDNIRRNDSKIKKDVEDGLAQFHVSPEAKCPPPSANFKSYLRRDVDLNIIPHTTKRRSKPSSKLQSRATKQPLKRAVIALSSSSTPAEVLSSTCTETVFPESLKIPKSICPTITPVLPQKRLYSSQILEQCLQQETNKITGNKPSKRRRQW